LAVFVVAGEEADDVSFVWGEGREGFGVDPSAVVGFFEVGPIELGIS